MDKNQANIKKKGVGFGKGKEKVHNGDQNRDMNKWVLGIG